MYHKQPLSATPFLQSAADLCLNFSVIVLRFSKESKQPLPLLMGMGTVFFGLICLIVLTYLMSAVVGRGKKAAPAPVPAAPQTAGEVTPELVAAVSAALAEELGTDITGIRIVSMKKV